MVKNRTSNLVFLLPLFLLGLFLNGCVRNSEVLTTPPPPTETLPAVAPGTTAIIDICDQEPTHPDCIPPETQDQSTADWQTFTDPENRFEFVYPNGWYTMTMTPDPSDGVRTMDAPSLEEANRWISVQVFQNPNRASLQVWIAEHGVSWPGVVTEEQEGWVNDVPVLRQRLENEDPSMGGPYIYALLWYPYEDLILCWTAWPGEQTETLSLLEQMASSIRKP